MKENLSNYYDHNQGFGVESNGVLYAGRYEVLYKIDISNIDAITETAHISLQNNVGFQHHWSSYGDTIIYQVYEAIMTLQTQEKFKGKKVKLIQK